MACVLDCICLPVCTIYEERELVTCFASILGRVHLSSSRVVRTRADATAVRILQLFVRAALCRSRRTSRPGWALLLTSERHTWESSPSLGPIVIVDEECDSESQLLS